MVVKILAIGNSFSEDATYYLHDLAQTAGIESKVVNLYRPSCSFKQHWESIESGGADYHYELNGQYDTHHQTNPYVTIQDVLKSEAWDHIVSQQASPESGILAEYKPYAENLYAYVKQQVPSAKLWLQETWAYETDSPHPAFPRYDCSQTLMYQKLKACYGEIQKDLALDLIPVGDLIQTLRSQKAFAYGDGGISLCRDGFHLTYGYGRFAAALLWFQTLLEGDIQTCSFVPKSAFAPEFKADPAVLESLKQTVLSFKN